MKPTTTAAFGSANLLLNATGLLIVFAHSHVLTINNIHRKRVDQRHVSGPARSNAKP